MKEAINRFCEAGLSRALAGLFNWRRGCLESVGSRCHSSLPESEKTFAERWFRHFTRHHLLDFIKNLAWSFHTQSCASPREPAPQDPTASLFRSTLGANIFTHSKTDKESEKQGRRVRGKTAPYNVGWKGNKKKYKSKLNFSSDKRSLALLPVPCQAVCGKCECSFCSGIVLTALMDGKCQDISTQAGCVLCCWS